jgi:CBS domain-containing protein
MNVNEAMTAPVRCCSPDSSLDDVARMMWAEDCGSIPVVDQDNCPVGVVTDRDIAMAAMLNHKPLWDICASDVTRGQRLVSCSQQEPIESCIAKMEENSVRRILVTDDAGKLCGIVSMGDAVAFAKEQPDPVEGCAIDSDQVLGMLKSVSAHHPSGDNPIAQIH